MNQHPSTVRCPECQTVNRVPRSRGPTLLLSCGRCGTEIGMSRPGRAYLVEALLFTRNLALLLLVPALAGYLFVHNILPVTSGFVFCVSVAVLSIALHEFFHALAAFLLGDYTILERGYLRLSLKKYFYGFHSLVLPLGVLLMTGIFLPGGAVLVQMEKVRSQFRHSLIFSAGVLANGLVFLVLISIAGFWQERNPAFHAILQYSALLQTFIIAFNLLPVPGLDGWNTIAPLFSQAVQDAANRASMVAIVAVTAAIILYPPIGGGLLDRIERAATALGTDVDAAKSGMDYVVLIKDGVCPPCAELVNTARAR